MALAASRISRVVASGFEIIGTWDARTSTTVAPARWAMNRWVAGGIALSWVATRYHEGIVFQAGSPDRDLEGLLGEGPLCGLHLVGDPAGNVTGEGLRNPSWVR